MTRMYLYLNQNVYIYYISWYKNTTVLSKFVTGITVSINDVYDTLLAPSMIYYPWPETRIWERGN